MAASAGDNAHKAHVQNLNALLADYFTLYFKTKSFHWHVAGPNFHDLHLLFDAQATELFALTDLLAERVRKNGADTLTSLAAIGMATRIKEEDSTTLAASDMVKALRDDNRKLLGALRETKQSATDAGDNATEGAIDDWTDQAEQRVWFLSQIVK